MNGDRVVDVFHNKCLRGILQIQWQDLVSTEELLERADMKPVSKEVKRSGWKMMGHPRKQDQNSDYDIAMTWATEARKKEEKDQRPPRGARLKTERKNAG